MSTPVHTPRGSRRSCYSHNVKSPEAQTRSTIPERSTKTPITNRSSIASTSSSAGRLRSPTRTTGKTSSNQSHNGYRSSAHDPVAKSSLKERISPCRGNLSEDVNDSTAASSVCESQHDGESTIASSRLLFAKASELIRVEIAAVERRLMAKVEIDRAERKSVCDQMANDLEFVEKRVMAVLETERSERKSVCEKQSADLEEMIGIVERLSARSDVECFPMLPNLEQERRELDTMLEEERRLRDMACASLHEKMEAIGLQVTEFQNVVDSIHAVLNHERQTNKALESSLQNLSAELSAKKGGQGIAIDEASLKVLMEEGRRSQDATSAELRAELRKELDDMAMEVRSLVIRAPLYDRLERQQKEAEMMCIKLREDIDVLSNKKSREVSSALMAHVRP